MLTPEDKTMLESIMFPLFDIFDNYDDIKDGLRSLHSAGVVDDEQYDMCLEYWDEILLDWESQS